MSDKPEDPFEGFDPLEHAEQHAQGDDLRALGRRLVQMSSYVSRIAKIVADQDKRLRTIETTLGLQKPRSEDRP